MLCTLTGLWRCLSFGTSLFQRCRCACLPVLAHLAPGQFRYAVVVQPGHTGWVRSTQC
jgi:hypothetical protein